MSELKGSAQTRAKNKYAKKTYDDLRIQVKKGGKAFIREYAEQHGKSINGLVNELLEAEIPALKAFHHNISE